MRGYIILLLAVSSSRASISIPNTSIRLFDMDFIRVDIVKDNCEDSEERMAKASSKEEESGDEVEHLEDDSLGLLKSGDTNLMSEDPPQSKCDYSFLEPIDLEEETPKDELLRMRKELDSLFEEID